MNDHPARAAADRARTLAEEATASVERDFAQRRHRLTRRDLLAIEGLLFRLANQREQRRAARRRPRIAADSG